MLKIKSALISVFDKNGIEPIAKELNSLGVEIFSTGGTESFLKNIGIPITKVEDITNYPSMIESANINVLDTYKSAFNIQVGYSDHSPGDLVILGAVAKGAVVVEKHFTDDKNGKGPDHPHSMEPHEFKEMIIIRKIISDLSFMFVFKKYSSSLCFLQKLFFLFFYLLKTCLVSSSI